MQLRASNNIEKQELCTDGSTGADRQYNKYFEGGDIYLMILLEKRVSFAYDICQMSHYIKRVVNRVIIIIWHGDGRRWDTTFNDAEIYYWSSQNQ